MPRRAVLTRRLMAILTMTRCFLSSRSAQCNESRSLSMLTVTPVRVYKKSRALKSCDLVAKRPHKGSFGAPDSEVLPLGIRIVLLLCTNAGYLPA